MMEYGQFEVGTVDLAGLVVDDADLAVETVYSIGATREDTVAVTRGQRGSQFTFGLKDGQ